jgi:YacP-like NYN domain
MLLIDAYNVLLSPGVLPPRLAGLEIEGLIRLLAVSRHARKRIRLVCDGSPPKAARVMASHAGRAALHMPSASSAGHAEAAARSAVDVIYAGPGVEADSYIEDFLERDSAARRWTVVSSDRRVRRAADRAGARSLTSEAFLHQLVTDEARPAPAPDPKTRHKIPLDSHETSHWMREFGYDGEFVSRPTPALNLPPRGRSKHHSDPRHASRVKTGDQPSQTPIDAMIAGSSSRRAAPPSHTNPRAPRDPAPDSHPGDSSAHSIRPSINAPPQDIVAEMLRTLAPSDWSIPAGGIAPKVDAGANPGAARASSPDHSPGPEPSAVSASAATPTRNLSSDRSPVTPTTSERNAAEYRPTPADDREPSPPPAPIVDPILLEALDTWRDRLSLEDLDMRRWLPPIDNDAADRSGEPARKDEPPRNSQTPRAAGRSRPANPRDKRSR